MIFPILIGGAIIYGVYKAVTYKEKPAEKVKITESRIPKNKMPKKLAFFDDLKKATKEGWVKGSMPVEYRQHYKWENGKWMPITKKQYNRFNVFNGWSSDNVGYRRNKKREKGKFVYDLIIKN